MERLDAGTRLVEMDHPGGQEIFILTGDLQDEHGRYNARTWIRNPAGYRDRFTSERGATYWVKRGHLTRGR